MQQSSSHIQVLHIFHYPTLFCAFEILSAPVLPDYVGTVRN